MSNFHPRQFAFNSYRQAGDGYRDYYGVTLRERAGGFEAGTQFDAASVRGDNAIHARQGTSTYYLGQLNGGYQANTGSARSRLGRQAGSSYQAMSGRSRGSYQADDGYDSGMSGSYSGGYSESRSRDRSGSYSAHNNGSYRNYGEDQSRY
jgi:hypothetical protein